MWVMQCYCWSWFSVEFCNNGVVSLMFDFSCRSDHPIDISRWVKLFVKLTYDLPACIYVIVVVCFHYVFFVCFLVRRRRRRRGRGSSSDGSGCTSWGSQLGREVALVGIIHVYTLSLLPFEWRCVSLGNNYITCYSLPCSNYDTRYYHKRFHIPTDSVPNPEEHEYGPEDPWALLQ